MKIEFYREMGNFWIISLGVLLAWNICDGRYADKHNNFEQHNYDKRHNDSDFVRWQYVLKSGSENVLRHKTRGSDVFPSDSVLPSSVVHYLERAQMLSSCQVVEYDQVIEIPGCQPRTLRLGGCVGLCPSLNLEITGVWGLLERTSSCGLCEPTQHTERKAQVDCEEGSWGNLEVTYFHVDTCQCRAN